MRSCFIAGGIVIAYVEAEGIDALGARVAENDIKRRRAGRWGTCSKKLIPRSREEVFHFD